MRSASEETVAVEQDLLNQSLLSLHGSRLILFLHTGANGPLALLRGIRCVLYVCVCVCVFVCLLYALTKKINRRFFATSLWRLCFVLATLS